MKGTAIVVAEVDPKVKKLRCISIYVVSKHTAVSIHVVTIKCPVSSKLGDILSISSGHLLLLSHPSNQLQGQWTVDTIIEVNKPPMSADL